MRPGNRPPPPPQVRWWKVALEALTILAGIFIVWGGLMDRADITDMIVGAGACAIGTFQLMQTASQHREYKQYLAKYPQHRP